MADAAIQGLEFFGKMLHQNIKDIIDIKDRAERTRKMIAHYNKVAADTKLAAMTRLGLLNLVRQMYNKNLTAAQKKRYKAEYQAILDNDKNEDHTKTLIVPK